MRFVFHTRFPWRALYALVRGGKVFFGGFVAPNGMAVVTIGVHSKQNGPIWWAEYRFPSEESATAQSAFVKRSEGPRLP